jgi:Domain of unknown function (DUF4303)
MLDELRNELEKATEKSFLLSVERHRLERIYCAALYTSSGYGYICDTISTFEGLNLVAHDYLKKKPGSTLDSLLPELKWSPCDSPYHLENEHLFNKSNELIESIWRSVREVSDQESDRIFREIHTVFIDVLKKVRAANILPQECLIVLLAGDQSDEARLVNAEEINDPHLCRALGLELSLNADRLAKLRADRWPVDDSYEP